MVVLEKIDSWNNLEIVNIKVARKKLMEWYNIVWANEISNKSKLNLYSKLKQNVGTANYIKLNIDKKKKNFNLSVAMGNFTP